MFFEDFSCGLKTCIDHFSYCFSFCFWSFLSSFLSQIEHQKQRKKRQRNHKEILKNTGKTWLKKNSKNWLVKWVSLGLCEVKLFDHPTGPGEKDNQGNSGGAAGASSFCQSSNPVTPYVINVVLCQVKCSPLRTTFWNN